jgi:HK97 family phage major capsid protein
VFVGHPDVVKYLKLEQDSQNRYFWDPYAQASPSVHGRYPIVESDDAPNTDGSSEEAMAFANFRYLLVGSRAGMTTLIDPYTQSGNWRTRFTFVRRLGLAYAKKNAFCRLITA